jgi:hypothetical protein
MQRTDACRAKLDRLEKALRHVEGDRVPVGDFFWGSFLERWRRERGLGPDADIHAYYDLDWFVTVPNMDPHIRSFETLRETPEEVVVKTGFEAVIRKKFADPMPEFVSFATDTLEKMEAFTFDDPWDDRRFFKGGEHQVGGVGDGFTRDLPAWMDTVRARHPAIPVFGSMGEAHELLWRIIGSANVMLWIGLYPDELGRFAIEMTRAQIRAGGGLLDGMVIWGDVAYVNGMLFSPAYWRRHFKPVVAEQVRICHDAGLPVIYHGCGNAEAIFSDFIEIGIDSYNPLEAKAGLDVVELRRRYGHRIGFCGNMDARAWATAPLGELRAQVLRKLNAARGGGFIFQSDHSVPGNVSTDRYEYVLGLVRQHGRYPLDLGESALPGV